MRANKWIVALLFVPAELGLLFQVAIAVTLAERLLALALALFCPELARMAVVDLQNIAAVLASAEQPAEDSRLSRFYRVVVSTIVLELAGFYGALFSLSAGAIAVIFSQLWFNLLAGIQLRPQESVPVESMGIAQRRAVLVANALGLGLLGLWAIASVRIWLATGLLALIVLFLGLKYGVPGTQRSRPVDPADSAN